MSSELHGISERWFKAWFDKDAALVDRLATQDYIYIAPSVRRSIARRSSDGKAFTDDHRGLMVWEKQGGEWRLVMEQNSFSQ